jgi:hypothetical protein
MSHIRTARDVAWQWDAPCVYQARDDKIVREQFFYDT